MKMHNITGNSTLILRDENNEKKVYYKLSEFSIEGKDNTYVVYTDYSETEEGINIYYGMYSDENVVPVTDKNDIEVILNYIEAIEEEIALED